MNHVKNKQKEEKIIRAHTEKQNIRRAGVLLVRMIFQWVDFEVSRQMEAFAYIQINLELVIQHLFLHLFIYLNFNIGKMCVNSLIILCKSDKDMLIFNKIAKSP